MATTADLKHSVVLVMGDPGGDGHGSTVNHTYACNRDTQTVEKLYDAAMKAHGIDITSECEDYEDSTLSDDFMDLFHELFADNQKILSLVDADNKIGTDEHGEIFLAIASLSDPELQWKRAYDRRATLHIGGYGHFYD